MRSRSRTQETFTFDYLENGPLTWRVHVRIKPEGGRMPSIHRPLGGDVLLFDLRAEHDHTPVTVPPGRSARTLVKDGPMRVTLIRIAPGGSIAEHAAPGPVTIQPLSGTITVTAEGVAHVLGPGRLLFLRPGVRHAVTGPPDAEGEFLLTLAHAPRTAPEPRT